MKWLESSPLRQKILTDTAGFVAWPLVIVLTCDAPFTHKFKSWLAEKGQHISMLKAVSATTTKRWHPRVTAASPFNLWNMHTPTKSHDALIIIVNMWNSDKPLLLLASGNSVKQQTYCIQLYYWHWQYLLSSASFYLQQISFTSAQNKTSRLTPITPQPVIVQC